MFCVALLIPAAYGSRQQKSQSADGPTIAKISAAVSKIKTMKCNFIQTKQMTMLNETMTTKGTMAYQKADRLRWEYTSPYKYTFVLNGSDVLIKNGTKTEKANAAQAGVFREIAQIMMNAFSGNSLTDTKDFTASLRTAKTEYVATLTPQRKDMKKMIKTVTLHINKEKAVVTKVELEEQSGDYTVIELKDIKTNVTLPASTFAIE